MATVATIGAIGSLLAGASAAGGLFRDTSQSERQNAITEQAAIDAKHNATQQQIIQALINRRSVAGSQDSFGSSVHYDPATNTWISDLGPLPQAEQTAASQASVSRNTTDLRQAQLANDMAMRRAARASPVADTAIRNLGDFRPQTSGELAGLMTGQATTANNAVMRPIIADTLRTFAREGTGAAPVLANLGRQSYDNLRDALVTGRIQALTNTDNINNTRRQGLESAATTASGLANPSLQFSGVNPSSQGSDLAKLVAARAQTSSTSPSLGQFGVNQGQSLNQQSLLNLAKSVPDPNTNLNNTLNSINQFSSLLQNKQSIGNILSLFGGSGTGSSSNPSVGSSQGFG